MSKQTINIGASPNDGTGTPLRTSFDYTNQNFTEIYTALGGGVALPGATTQVIFNDGGTNLAGDAGLVYNKTTDALTVAGLVTAGSATITGALTSGTTTLVAHAAGYTGKVGIGTATPAYKLDVSSATASNQLRISGSSQNSMVFANAAAGPSNGFLVGRSIGSDDSNNLFFYDLATSAVRLFIGSTGNIGIGTGVTPGEALEVSSGNVKLNNGNVVMGTSGKGIDFSATANSSGTMTSELLNDYEEGTWTPVATNLTVVGSVTYTGKYTKIGRVVYINLKVLASTSSSSVANSTEFSGLPFAPADTAPVTAANANTVASLGAGIMDTNSKLYPPTWTSVANAVLSGFYYV